MVMSMHSDSGKLVGGAGLKCYNMHSNDCVSSYSRLQRIEMD